MCLFGCDFFFVVVVVLVLKLCKHYRFWWKEWLILCQDAELMGQKGRAVEFMCSLLALARVNEQPVYVLNSMQQGAKYHVSGL